MKYPNLEQFLESVKNHELKVNLDQGLYRDLTIKQPGTSDRHFHITTRPGYLMLTGDMGSFVFTRLKDMFNFFRDEDGYSIRPSYWEEKLEAVCSRDGAKEFDCEKVDEALKQELSTFLEDLDTNDEDDLEKIEAASEAVENFINFTERDEWGYVAAIRDWDASDAGGLDLTDFWEHGTETWTYRYIWCCYAIVHAIKLFDQYKARSHEERKQVVA